MDRCRSDVDPAQRRGGRQPFEGKWNLGLPLATVSRKVSELEAHLNTTLIT